MVCVCEPQNLLGVNYTIVNTKIIEMHVMSLVHHAISSGGSKGGAPPTDQIFVYISVKTKGKATLLQHGFIEKTNLMFALSSHKDQRKVRFCFHFRSV